VKVKKESRSKNQNVDPMYSIRRSEGMLRKLLTFSTVVLLVFVPLLFSPTIILAAGAREIELGEAFPPACADCHGPDPKYPVLGTRLGYDTSGHKNNANSYYANGGGCQRCHTNEGFQEYVRTGKVEGYVSYPSQPSCFTCHQARGNARQIVKATPAKDVRSYWGAHHGPQSDVVNGTNAWEFPGKNYSSSPHKTVVKDGCAQCHMALPEGRYSFSPELGGHSYRIAGEVHEAGKLNLSSCTSCHKDIKQVGGKEIFDLRAEADFDLDGTIEPLQEEVEGILAGFVNDRGTGYLQRTNPPMYKPDGSWNQTSSNAVYSEIEMAALYNYKFFLEDRSNGVHNATYAIQVLYDTLKALDPRLDDSLRPK
jgi:hypothetical protein